MNYRKGIALLQLPARFVKSIGTNKRLYAYVRLLFFDDISIRIALTSTGLTNLVPYSTAAPRW
jgi:hypothetical protein